MKMSKEEIEKTVAWLLSDMSRFYAFMIGLAIGAQLAPETISNALDSTMKSK